MISSTLNFSDAEDAQGRKLAMQAARKNMVFVNTKHSQDGRSLEGVWIPYNPNDSYALFLLTFTLDQSEGVDYYSIYDANGDRIKDFDQTRWPKRT
jgi:hypothetical protein